MSRAFSRLACVGAVAALFAAAPAMAVDPGFYGGVNVGATDMSYNSSDFSAQSIANSVAAQTGDVVTVGGSMRTSQTAVGAYGGYRFNQYLALEVGYEDLGHVYGNYTITTNGTPYPFQEGWRTTSTSFSAIGSYPVWRELSIFGRLGASLDNTRTDGCTTVGLSVYCSTGSSRDTTAIVGVGVQYNFTPNFALRAEYDTLGTVGDEAHTGRATASFATIGASIYF